MTIRTKHRRQIRPEQERGLDTASMCDCPRRKRPAPGFAPAAQTRAAGSAAGFTLIETVIAFLILAIVVLAFYAALSFGFTTIRLAQENVCADQILMQKLETIRVYHWSQVFTPGYLPQTFTNSYSASAGTNLYTGTITVANFPVSGANESYADSLRQVTITLNWISAGVPRTRNITSFVSQYGLQTYRR